MNIYFIQGKIEQDIEFQFFYNNKKISIAKANITIKEGSIRIIGYNEMADWKYHYLEKEETILVQGKLNSNMELEVERITRIILRKQ